MMDKETFDREFYPNIVIRTIETKLAMAENRKQNEMFVTLDVMHDILSMLKEQPQIVRCKDCKYWDQLMEHRGLCHELTNTHSEAFVTSSDWYCADGERRTNHV